jgi:hypothetical protein
MNQSLIKTTSNTTEELTLQANCSLLNNTNWAGIAELYLAAGFTLNPTKNPMLCLYDGSIERTIVGNLLNLYNPAGSDNCPRLYDWIFFQYCLPLWDSGSPDATIIAASSLLKISVLTGLLTPQGNLLLTGYPDSSEKESFIRLNFTSGANPALDQTTLMVYLLFAAAGVAILALISAACYCKHKNACKKKPQRLEQPSIFDADTEKATYKAMRCD